ncbi:glycoside hydrolase family 3 protein [Moniliophthora roreri MCA 2997]|uniref:beta-glucosidase n=2 Tax=Moniliophthora roreri TaxID=221103 RepID=V2Y2Y9_MONRO|nr:glycoside hydrolase family 3 protein [Moniliophthora roreri MCA 2997]
MLLHQLFQILAIVNFINAQSSGSVPDSTSSAATALSPTPSISAPFTSIPNSVTLISSATTAISSTPSISAPVTSISSPVTVHSSQGSSSFTQQTSISISVPSQSPIPGLFPSTDPQDPPDVKYSSVIVPDFLPAWEAAYEKARAKVAGFTLEELVSATTGIAALRLPGRCVGNIASLSSNRGWPGLCLQDSPLGVRLADFVTSFSTGLNTAATFNRTLIRQRGLFMGLEHRGKGVNIALGPMMNILRVAEAGRNFEGFGADPFLAGEAAYETILGMQQGGVQACAKHFIDNEQETSRTTSTSNVDDRTQHEIYAHPFLRSVMAGAASVMCSYNQVNGTYACENNSTLNGLLKDEFGFRGFVMSDWGATHSTVASTLSGLDMDMPGSGGPNGSFFGSTLVEAVRNGSVPMSRIQDMTTRIFAAWYFLHQDSSSYPSVNFNGNNPADEATNEHIDVQEDHRLNVRAIGAASVILLKNVDNALPLKKPRSLFLAGSDAGPGRIGPNEFRDQNGNDGILGMGWGSGTANFTYLISPYEAIQRRAIEDHTSVSWIFDDFNLPRAGNMAIGRSAALVFVNADSGEGSDRANLTLWHGGESLIQAVAAQNNNTIVITHSVGPLIIESWIDHPNITAVLWAGAPGQEAGNSITDILYGDFNPSGRLPFTIAKRAEDYPAHVVRGSGIVSVPYTEGLEIDYRAFDARNITPRFEFGFGLSYSTFEYRDLDVTPVSEPSTDEQAIKDWESGKTSRLEFGSSVALWLHQPAFKVTFTVKNVGSVAGGEIPQLYIGHPPSASEPPLILKGFSDVFLHPGQSERVTIHLSRHALSIWDTVGQGWKRPEGSIGVVIGASSRDERLRGTIAIA